MAAPSAPAAVTVKPGPNPQSARIGCTASVGATTYNFYWSNATGVDTSTYKGKKTGVGHNYVVVEGINYRKVFAVATATNADGTSAAASEASGFTAQ